MDPEAFPLTRADALARLDEFVPFAGAAYAAKRNLVDPGGHHRNVSRLSAALRRRLVGEDEVVRAVLAQYSYKAAEQFIAEVFWRTYWKGWLEHRPSIWHTAQQDADPVQLGTGALARLHDSAIAGQTGIDAFDHWAHELERTGYMHNWARMQVASIWVHTLCLPWALGAAWMHARLIDADPASNTLSWRWVAGLHTAGKAYLADSGRIAAMTGGRFAPQGLAEVPHIAAEPALPARTPPRQHQPLGDDRAPTMILLTPEDLSLETVLPSGDIRAACTVDSLAANQADTTAQADALARAGAHWGCETNAVAAPDDALALAQRLGCSRIVTGYAPVGPVADALGPLSHAAAAHGLVLAEHQREWDKLSWPHCTKGFFQLKTRIPAVLEELGLART